MSKVVYLDSSDFSDLSAPQERLRSEDSEVLTALLRARDTGDAIFALSPPLMSEAVHATAANKEDSTRRGSLISKLCGTNTVLYPTDILKMELTEALAGKVGILPPSKIISADNEWFGRPYDITSLASARKSFRTTLRSRLKEQLKLLPRDQRRKAKARLDISEPIREVLESDESDVIPCWALDSPRSAPCGHPNIAALRTATACVIRAI